MEYKNDMNISPDQEYYDQEPVAPRDEHKKWMREIEHYFKSYEERLNNSLANTSGVVVELGAGSCGLSICLSRLENVKKIYSLDISMARMQKMIALSGEILGGDLRKVEPVASDFNASLPFDNGTVDAVLFDAALHHSRSIWHLLAECRRVLRSGGYLIAQRESYLSTFRASGQIKNLLQTPEVAASVSENIYLLAQYEYYLRVHGFEVEFIKRPKGLIKSALNVMNGTLFTDGVIWCQG